MTVLLDAALRSSCVLALALCACAALRRCSPALRHTVLAVGICVAPFAAPLGWMAPPWEVHLPLKVAPADEARPGAGAASDQVANAPIATAGTSMVRLDEDAPRTWSHVLLGVWAGGSVVALAWLLIATVRLTSMTRAATPLPAGPWYAVLDDARQAAGISRAVDLRASPRPDLLATCGWRRPCILVPAAALTWPAARIDAVLRHELAHVRRADWLVHLHAAAVRALLWWNPLAWLACRRLAIEGELACDDAVLAQGVPADTYAEHLIAVVRTFRPSRSALAIATPMARPSTLRRRIVAMLNPHSNRAVPTRRMSALVIGCALTMLVPVAALRSAQGSQPLEGVVYDATGAVLPEVSLTLSGGAEPVQAVSDASGRFVLGPVAPGRYVLQAQLPGFRALRQDVELADSGDWDRAVTLQVGDLRETINVRERRVAAAGSAAAPAPSAVRVGGNIKPPTKLKDVRPVYPASMRDAGREGVVPIEAIIDKTGRVSNARVLTAQVHPDFAIAAIDAVRQWQFSPTLLNGKAVDVVMTVSVTFDLE